MWTLALFLLAAGAVGPGKPTHEDRREAARLYSEARALFKSRTEKGLRSSLPLFEKAVALAPDLAEAHAGLADAECLLALYGFESPAGALPRAEVAAHEAIALSPDLAAAHASLGLVRYLYHLGFEEAEASFRKSIALDPGVANVHHWYAMMLMATGRHREALDQVEAASNLEPDSPLYATKRGTILISAGSLDEAERHLREVVTRFPSFAMAFRELGEIEIARGRLDRALALLERARDEPTYFYVLGRLGRRTEVRERLAELRRLEATGYVSTLDFALLYAGLGDDGRALDEIERAFAARDPAIVYLAEQPAFAALRCEPRFQSVLSRLGLRGSR